MGALPPLLYSLNSEPRVKWTATQEKTVLHEYPFPSLQEETVEQHVARTYLQFLWLPDSIMPLRAFVPSLLRVSSDPPQSEPHPLHALLDACLLTPRASANKYHTELPQILSDGGGAGELEEGVMWFAVNHERWDISEETDEEVWQDEKWRIGYLERMQRREVQIQILLHLLKLSLPGPLPGSSLSSPKKRKRSARTQPAPIEPSTEEHLESFMDKLSMWQLVMALNSKDMKDKGKQKEDRDWMQIFCEDIVEPQFKAPLPSFCALLRMKVFPDSPFADEQDPDALSSRSRSSSPLPSNQPPSKRARSSSVTSAHPRSRSRSLSVSLALERSESVGTATKKRTLNREVSMSRVFKIKKKDVETNRSTAEKSGAPEKRERSTATSSDKGVTLVAATPVKVRGGSRRASPFGSQHFGDPGPGRIQNGKFSSAAPGEEEEMWDLPSSPDILLLGRGVNHQLGFSDGEDEVEERLRTGRKSVILVADTPKKNSSGRP